MQDPYSALVALVRFDDETRLRHSALIKQEESLASVYMQIRKNEELVAQNKEAYRTLEKRQDQLVLELRSCEQEGARIAKRLDTAGHGREFEALTHEQENLQNRCMSLEVDLEKTWEQLAQSEASLNSSESELDRIRVQSECEIVGYQDMIAQVKRELAEREASRMTLVQQVRPEWISQYEQMRERIANPFVPLKNGCCGGCGGPVSRVDVAAVERHQLATCQVCRRILYDSSLREDANATESLG